MKNTSSLRRYLRLGLRLFAMFCLIMIGYTIAYAPGARSPLALSAESEPMVSLPGGVPPQASQLLAAATPANAAVPLQLRIFLDIRNKQAARQMTDDLQDPSSLPPVA